MFYPYEKVAAIFEQVFRDPKKSKDTVFLEIFSLNKDLQKSFKIRNYLSQLKKTNDILHRTGVSISKLLSRSCEDSGIYKR
jgi:hypothetical protein